MAIDLLRDEWSVRDLAERVDELEGQLAEKTRHAAELADERDRLAARVRQLISQSQVDQQAIARLRSAPTVPWFK